MANFSRIQEAAGGSIFDAISGRFWIKIRCKSTQYLQNELKKAQQADASRQLLAPINGVVQQLSVFTVGGVVTPAEQLMVIVPDDEDLIVEAMVLNKDYWVCT